MSRSALLLPLVLVAACADEPLDLAPRREAGQEDVYAYSYRQHIVVPAQGAQPQEVDIDQTLDLVWRERVEAVAPDRVRSSLTFESTGYRMLMKSGGETRMAEHFDSNDPESEPSLNVRGYAGLVGRGVELTLGPTGELLELAGADEMVEAIRGEMYGSGLVADTRAGESFARQVSREALEDLLRPVKDVHPERPVLVGDTWTRRFELHAGFPRVEESTYELVSVTDRQATVRVTSTVSPQEGEPISYFGELAARTALSGTMQGELVLDRATGLVQRAELESALEGEMTVLGGDAAEDTVKAMRFEGRLRLKKVE